MYTYRCQSPVSINLALICFITCSSEFELDIASTGVVTVKGSERLTQKQKINLHLELPHLQYNTLCCVHEVARSQSYAFRTSRSSSLSIYNKKERKTRQARDKTIKQQPEQLERQLCPKTLLVQVAVWLGKSRSGSEQSSRLDLANVS